MRIAGTEINLKHKALEIYVSGCQEPHCSGCHNPELWNFGVGDSYPAKRIQNTLDWKIDELKRAKLIDSAWILGGEPLDQNLRNLSTLIRHLKESKLKVMLWTHYDYVPNDIKGLVDYVKTGRYDKDGEPYVEPVLGIKLANKEQKVTRIK